ncbi:hypothetical protein TVAG_266610 [Trichomonas vaginalis G3]|uniref:Uncharacterized protein n=1 Tax=Trichomonas vaginalis (strain ATCC PRA-98 / G3) TaxID=412133 RepID=A2DQL4_TRIV3|nr:hypothetical protein TVAGG3_0591590 [Trichomonas vaginalis G3]EAY17298.1 hypothetical protein TVAG_266610 [Trichomonas vaginalis G3]KAI5523299.1 hypothetical protein TVAGG3_0591590 [Trichomonas vaginalis G3]|eukprot:XP_001329521.1 hypothetical protein [Trichomonas vaginalis G3]
MSVRGDSLQPDNEFPDEYIEDCPWMEMTMKDYGVITEFDHPFKKTGKNIKSRDLDFDIDESENSVFDNKSIKAGPDFYKKCKFRFAPGVMFNYQIKYENE